MVKVDTAPDDDNEENNNIGQEHADRLYSSASTSEVDRDRLETQRMERDEAAGKGDRTQADMSPEERREALAKQEEEGEEPPEIPYSPTGNEKGKGIFGKLATKGGATGSIIGLVVAFASVASILGAPAALLVAVERIFTNNGTHDTRANTTMARARLGAVFGSAKDSVCSTAIKCKVASMSPEEIKTWKSIPGVQIEEGRTVFGRKTITSMTIEQPGGKPLKITSSAQFQDALQNNEHFRTLYARSTASKASTFIGPDSKVKTIANKYKMKLSSPWRNLKTKANDKKEQVSQAVNEALGKAIGKAFSESARDRVARIKSKVSAITDRVKTSAGGKAVKQIGNVAGIASIACTLYTMQEATLTAIKLSYYTDLIQFFLPFVQLANDIQSGDPLDPAIVSEIGDKYTWYQPAGANLTPEQIKKIGLTATDSQGFQAALYGDYGKLQDFTKHYAPWYVLTQASVSGVLKSLIDGLGGEGNVHKACLTSKYASYLGVLGSGAAGAALYAGCELTNWLADNACAKLIAKGFQEIIDLGMDDVYKEIEKFALNSDLKGVDLGNALAAGIGLFLMEKSRGSGLRPAATPAAVSTFLSSTEGDYQLNVQTQKDIAKTTPFDVTNQYSFISNLTTMFSQYKAEQTTGFSVLANLFSVTTSSFAYVTGTANAGYFQPIESVDRPESLQSMTAAGTPGGRSCQDIDMTNIGMICDWTGRSIDVLDTQVLEWGKQMQVGDTSPWIDTIDYMVGDQGPEKNADSEQGYIDEESGEPIGYSNYNSNPDPENYEEEVYKNPYLMWKAYCTNDRIYPLGRTMKSKDDDDANEDNMGWFLGSKCAGNDVSGAHISSDFDTMLDRFFFYYNMCETQLGVADGNQKCWDDNIELAAATTNTGPWQIPVVGQCGDGFDPNGTRIGRNHKGIDIAASEGTPILAPTSMKIVFVGESPDKSTGYQVTATATDGSNNSFRFMHMSELSPLKAGQEVSKGDPIGKVGNSGDSHGAHLHMDVFPSGVDPMSYSGQIDPVQEFGKHGVAISCR